MATIKQMFELIDGVSPVLNKIEQTVDKTIGRFDRAAKAASGMETAATVGANGLRVGAERAASPVHTLGGLVDGLNDKMRGVGDGIHVSVERTISPAQRLSGLIDRLRYNLRDIRTAPFSSIRAGVSGLAGDLVLAAKAATAMGASAGLGANAIRLGAERAAFPIYMLTGLIDGLSQKVKNVGNGAFRGLKEGLSGMVGQFALATIAANAFMAALSYIAGIPERLVRASDAYAGIQARLRMVAGGIEQAAEMNDLIYASAQRARGSYELMADSVSKIAMTAKKAFPDARDVVPFMEGIQKLFVIGGTAVEQQKNALLQLTQALGSGKLQGDEFRSIAEAAPLIQKMVAAYMQIDEGQLKAISSEGKITADILRNSILTNLDLIEEQFGSMGWKWEQVMQVIENAGQRAFAPVFKAINDLANSAAGQAFANAVVWGLHIAAAAILGVINAVVGLGTVVYQVGSYIGSWLGAGFSIAYQYLETFIDLAIAGLAVYAGYWVATNVLIDAHVLSLAAATIRQWAMNAASAAYSALLWAINLRTALVTAATSVWTLVTGGLTAAWRALNVVMYMNPIGLVIGLVLVAIGVFTAWVMHTYGLRNALASAFSAMAGIVANAVNFMIDRINNLIQMINKAAEGINGLFGTDIGMVGEISYRADPGQWSKDAEDFVQNFDIHNYLPGVPEGLTPSAAPYVPGNAMPYDGTEDLGKSGRETADNTGAMKEAMEISDEDLKYLREAAEQEAINQYTTATVQIDMGGVSNNISSGMDLDGVMAYMTDGLLEAMAAGAEAVHPT